MLTGGRHDLHISVMAEFTRWNWSFPRASRDIHCCILSVGAHQPVVVQSDQPNAAAVASHATVKSDIHFPLPAPW